MSFAKKEFGQHFLSNLGVIEKIVRLTEGVDLGQKKVLEIGPGRGALTEALLNRGFCVTACEIDKDMVEFLKEKFSKELASGALTILHADFMTVEASDIPLLPVAVGNLPYNVGSQILFRFLEKLTNYQGFVFMLQKEVVEKFLGDPSQPKNYGPPSVKFHLLADLYEKFWVSPGSFTPPPRVDSGVLAFRRNEKQIDPHSAAYQRLSELLKLSFSQRRKKMRNTAKEWNLGNFEGSRPEELLPTDFLEIAKQGKGS